MAKMNQEFDKAKETYENFKEKHEEETHQQDSLKA